MGERAIYSKGAAQVVDGLLHLRRREQRPRDVEMLQARVGAERGGDCHDRTRVLHVKNGGVGLFFGEVRAGLCVCV